MNDEVHIMEDLSACRVCLATGVKLYNLYNFNLKNAYENLTGCDISIPDSLPHHLCGHCQCLLLKSYRFKECCIQAQDLLKCAVSTAPMLTLEYIQALTISQSPIHSLSYSPIETSSSYFPDPDILIKLEVLKEELTDQSDEEPLSKKVKSYSKFEFGQSSPEIVKKNNDRSKIKNYSSDPDSDKNEGISDNETMDFDINDTEPLDFLRKEDIELVILSKEQQIEEVSARKSSHNYRNSFYKCELCFKGFLTEITYKNHMGRHDPSSGSHTCDICHTRWPNTRAVKAHTITAHERRYNCRLCTHTSKSCHKAKEHLKWHNGHTFTCKICGATFTKSTSHLTHLRLQHPSNFTCDVCGESFIGQTGLNMHKKKSHRRYDGPKLDNHLKCTICCTQFKSIEGLKRHVTLTNGICDNNMCVCVYCGEGFPERDLLKEHHKTHQKDESIKCEECNRTFAHERSFAIHYQRVHLGIRLKYKKSENRTESLVVCEICGKKCISNATLVYHQRTHTGEKPFQCSHCPKKFSVYQRLQIHIRTHTGESPFQCSHCPKAFKHKAALNRHDRVHTGAKPYQCSHCNKSFSQSNSMKLHVRTVHLKMPAPYRNRRTVKFNE